MRDFAEVLADGLKQTKAPLNCGGIGIQERTHANATHVQSHTGTRSTLKPLLAVPVVRLRASARTVNRDLLLLSQKAMRQNLALKEKICTDLEARVALRRCCKFRQTLTGNFKRLQPAARNQKPIVRPVTGPCITTS